MCCSDINCNGEIGVMSARECCVDTPNGLAYRIPTVERSIVCIGECIHDADYQAYCDDLANFVSLLCE